MNYPPSWNMLKIMVACGDEGALLRETDRVKADIDKEMSLLGEEGIKIFGPSPANIYKLNDVYRMIFYIKSSDYRKLVILKDELGERQSVEKAVSLQFDFNPI